MSEERPHQLKLFGYSQLFEELMEQLNADRLHHALLLEGPDGIGKSLLAKCLAAAALGGHFSANQDVVAFETSDPVAMKVVSSGHPDLRIIARKPDEKGNLPQDIPVSDMRGISEFFSLKPALGGRRIALIDSLDELNRFGANAVLKTLEEPPPGSLLILIAHQRAPVLPTIRSRCRSIRLGHLPDAATKSVFNTVAPDAEISSDQFPASLQGRPGAVLKWLEADVGSITRTTKTLLSARPLPMSSSWISTVGQTDITFEFGTTLLLDGLRIKAKTADSETEAGYWAGIWCEVRDKLNEAKQLNMDHIQTLAAIMAVMARSR